MSLDEWLKSGRYLPPALRDFHDQKDVFKLMHSRIKVEGHEFAKDVNWIAGQCYVIDIFLWFMVRRGYTLQRSRAHLAFNDLDAEIQQHNNLMADQFAALIATSGEPAT